MIAATSSRVARRMISFVLAGTCKSPPKTDAKASRPIDKEAKVEMHPFLVIPTMIVFLPSQNAQDWLELRAKIQACQR